MRRFLSLSEVHLQTTLPQRKRKAREMSEWQPIETAPKDGTRILVSFGTMGVWLVSWDTPEWWGSHDDGSGIWCTDDNKHGPYALRGYNDDGPRAPTHWMPLPAPPTK